MDRYMDAEARFLQADILLENGEIVEAKTILEEILQDEPDYGRAHNHLGWIFRARLSDFKRATYHLRLAVKFAPDYPGAYINYGNILMETGKYAELDELAQNAMNVLGINKAYVFHFMAVAKEMTIGPAAGIKYLKKALDESMDEQFSNFLKSEMKRVKGKMTTLSRIAVMF